MLPKKEDLYEVFDRVSPSSILPFCVLAVQNTVYTKLYSHIVPPIAWVAQPKPQNGMYFFLLHSSQSNIAARINRIIEGAGEYYDDEHVIISRHYSRCVWTPENRIEIELTDTSKATKRLILQRLKQSLPGLDYEIILKHQSRVTGSTAIAGSNLYVVPFADLVTNDKLFRKFLFFYERRRTILNSDKNLGQPSVFFSWDPISSKLQSTSVLINLSISKKLVELQFGRARTKREAEVAVKIFKVLFAVCNSKTQELNKLYNSLIPKDKRPNFQFKATKRGRNIGRRAVILQNSRPELFVLGYPGKCGKEKQPRLVSGKKAKKLISRFAKRFKEQGVENFKEMAKHKLLNFPNGSDDWYVCDPRDEDEKKPHSHLWPALMENKIATNREENPYFPCCFIKDHLGPGKVDSHLKNYLESIKTQKNATSTAQSKKKKIQKQQEKSYDLGADKLLDLGRMGKIPHYLSQLLESHDPHVPSERKSNLGSRETGKKEPRYFQDPGRP